MAVPTVRFSDVIPGCGATKLIWKIPAANPEAEPGIRAETGNGEAQEGKSAQVSYRDAGTSGIQSIN